MQDIRQLKDRLCKELEEYSNNGRLDIQTLQIIDTIAHTVKNLNKILDEKEKEERYNEGYYYGNNRSNVNGRVNATYSNRYYPDNMWDNYNNGYNSRRYSMGNEMIVDKLRNLMNETSDERTRQEFQTFINRMETM